jgi:hypothetical protein
MSEWAACCTCGTAPPPQKIYFRLLRAWGKGCQDLLHNFFDIDRDCCQLERLTYMDGAHQEAGFAPSQSIQTQYQNLQTIAEQSNVSQQTELDSVEKIVQLSDYAWVDTICEDKNCYGHPHPQSSDEIIDLAMATSCGVLAWVCQDMKIGQEEPIVYQRLLKLVSTLTLQQVHLLKNKQI